MLTRRFPRFLIQAALLIVVAAIAAAIHLGPLTIVLVIAAAFGIVVGTEWLATRESKPKEEAKPEPAATATRGGGDPAASRRLAASERAAGRRAPPVERLRAPEPGAARSPAGIPARDEELSFLLLYLREFTDNGGDLNEEFDTFIRESFPATR